MTDRKMAAELRANCQLKLEGVLKKLRCKEAVTKELQEERARVKETLKTVQAEFKKEAGDIDAIEGVLYWFWLK
jgi:hypothetical protein